MSSGQSRAEVVAAPGARGARGPFEARIEGVSIEVLPATVFGPALLSVEGCDGDHPLADVRFRVDRGPWAPLRPDGERWSAELPTRSLVEGPHTIEVAGVRTDGLRKKAEGTFLMARRIH